MAEQTCVLVCLSVPTIVQALVADKTERLDIDVIVDGFVVVAVVVEGFDGLLTWLTPKAVSQV